MHIDTIRTMGRAAQGVRLINLKGNSEIAAIARVPRSEDEEEEMEIDGENPIDSNESAPDSDNGTEVDNDGAVE
jgi:DNA gyrase subunit A